MTYHYFQRLLDIPEPSLKNIIVNLNLKPKIEKNRLIHSVS